jgi:hypothetical protein
MTFSSLQEAFDAVELVGECPIVGGFRRPGFRRNLRRERQQDHEEDRLFPPQDCGDGQGGEEQGEAAVQPHLAVPVQRGPPS